LTNFRSELALAYKDFGEHVISTDQPSFFKNTSFTFAKENGNALYMLMILSQSALTSLEKVLRSYEEYFVIGTTHLLSLIGLKKRI